MPNTCYLLDEANGVHSRTASRFAQERCVQQGLGRRLSLNQTYLFYLFLSIFRINFDIMHAVIRILKARLGAIVRGPWQRCVQNATAVGYKHRWLTLVEGRLFIMQNVFFVTARDGCQTILLPLGFKIMNDNNLVRRSQIMIRFLFPFVQGLDVIKLTSQSVFPYFESRCLLTK